MDTLDRLEKEQDVFRRLDLLAEYCSEDVFTEASVASTQITKIISDALDAYVRESNADVAEKCESIIKKAISCLTLDDKNKLL